MAEFSPSIVQDKGTYVCAAFWGGGVLPSLFSEGTLQTKPDLNKDVGLIYVLVLDIFWGDCTYVLKSATNVM